MTVKNRKGSFSRDVLQIVRASTKKRRLLRPARKTKQGEIVHCGYGIT
jgi:hypothetical protein